MGITRLITVLALTALFYAVDVSAYAARLAGVRTGRPAQAGSLYNLLALSARAANAVQTTLLAGLVDQAVAAGTTDPLTTILRATLLATGVGIVIGATLLPSLSRLLARGVHSYEHRRSLPRVILHSLSTQVLPRARQELRPPHPSTLFLASRHRLPWRWIGLTVGIAAIYAVAGPAAHIASATTAQEVRTVMTLPAYLTGIGTVLMALLVDPLTAHVVDEALRGKRPPSDVTYITVWQIGGRLAGTLLAQLLLMPAARLLTLVAQFLV